MGSAAYGITHISLLALVCYSLKFFASPGKLLKKIALLLLCFFSFAFILLFIEDNFYLPLGLQKALFNLRDVFYNLDLLRYVIRVLVILFALLLLKDALDEKVKATSIILVSVSIAFLLLYARNYAFTTDSVALSFAIFIMLIIWDDVITEDYYFYMGNLSYSQGDYAKASLYYGKLLEIPNCKSVPYNKLRKIYLLQNRKDEKAKQVYETLYRENPEDRELVLALSEIYAKNSLESNL